MDAVYEYSIKHYNVFMPKYQLFFAESKVPICLAITELSPFLNGLKDAGFISEEESLELQADTRSVPRVVYECLCWMEEKDISLQKFFKHLFQETYLKNYPDLQQVLKDFKEAKFRSGIPSSADTDTDRFIFAQDKVPICLAITDRFPFLHGLQDFSILSETESLKLQADERPVSRVIYECLCLIEKKDMKLNVVFEYIFQQCYLKVYPALQEILQESSREQAGPFNGRKFPVFSRAEDLLDFFEHNKSYICDALNERFPILHGLQDERLLSRLQMLTLQADKRASNEVMYDALSLIEQQNKIDQFFAYVFQDFYLELFPDLRNILQNLNDASELEIYPPSPDVAVFEVILENEVNEVQEAESSGPSTDVDDTEAFVIRKCRMKHINYSEPPDLDLERVEHVKAKKRHKENSLQRRYKKRQVKRSERRDRDDHGGDLDPGNSLQKKFKKRRVKQQEHHKPNDIYCNLDGLA